MFARSMVLVLALAACNGSADDDTGTAPEDAWTFTAGNVTLNGTTAATTVFSDNLLIDLLFTAEASAPSDCATCVSALFLWWDDDAIAGCADFGVVGTEGTSLDLGAQFAGPATTGSHQLVAGLVPEVTCATATWDVNLVELDRVLADVNAVSPPAFSLNTTYPSASATGIRPDLSAITLQFTEDIDPASVTASDFTITPSVPFATSVNGNQISLTPTTDLAFEQTYSVSVGTDIFSTLGQGLSSSAAWSFDTQDYLRISSVVPTDAATKVRIDTPLVLTFDAQVDASTVSADTLRITADTWVEDQYRPEIQGSVVVSGSTVTFTPEGGLWQEYETGYTISPLGVESTTGQPLAGGQSSSFTAVFWDSDYLYKLHTEVQDETSALSSYGQTYEAYLSTGNTTGTFWYFFDVGNGYWGMRNNTGGDALWLESGDGAALSQLQPSVSGTSLYSGQWWEFVHYNPRESGEVQLRGESPGNYYLKTQWQGADMALTMSYNATSTNYEGRMAQRTATVYQLWWFERAGLR